MYSEIKELVFGLFPFSYDATLVLIGLLIWLIAGLIFRLPMTRLASIVPVIVITVCVEISDVMFLAQAPIRAVTDFGFVVIPVLIIVFFQHQGWARA